MGAGCSGIKGGSNLHLKATGLSSPSFTVAIALNTVADIVMVDTIVIAEVDSQDFEGDYVHVDHDSHQ